MLTANETTLTLSQGELHHALKTVRCAISDEKTRYYFCGVYVHADQQAVHFVATNGHILGRVTVKTDDDYSGMTPVILPADFVADAVKATSKRRYATSRVALTLSPTRVAAPLSEEILEATPIDGTYPDYLRVIPQGVPAHGVITIPAEPLGIACKALAGYKSVDRNRNHCTIVLSFGQNDLQMSAAPFSPKDVTFTTATATIEGVSNPDYKETQCVGFNANYLADIVKALDAAAIAFHFHGADGPNVFTNPADGSMLFVLMPCRI